MRLGVKAGGGFLALVALWLGLGAVGARPRGPEAPPLPDFQWPAITAAGPRVLSAADMSGGPWVANFIFTRCSGPCPLMTQRMGQVAAAARPGVKLVTFTVDPDHDSLERLQSYADRAGAKDPRWYFVRLEKKALYDLVSGYLRLPLARNEGGDDGFQFTHSTRFVLMGPGNRFKGLFDSVDGAFPKRLIAAIEKEMPS